MCFVTGMYLDVIPIATIWGKVEVCGCHLSKISNKLTGLNMDLTCQ